MILAKELDPTQVSPGVPGFMVTFALALACWLLFRSLTTHLRRVNHSAAGVEPGDPGADDAAGPVEDDAAAEPTPVTPEGAKS
jgi:hypothetical protein